MEKQFIKNRIKNIEIILKENWLEFNTRRHYNILRNNLKRELNPQ